MLKKNGRKQSKRTWVTIFFVALFINSFFVFLWQYEHHHIAEKIADGKKPAIVDAPYIPPTPFPTATPIPWLEFTGETYTSQIKMQKEEMDDFSLKVPEGWKVTYQVAPPDDVNSGSEHLHLTKNTIALSIDRYQEWESSQCNFVEPGPVFIPDYNQLIKGTTIWNWGLISGESMLFGEVCASDPTDHTKNGQFYNITKIGFISFTIKDKMDLPLVEEVLKNIEIK